MLDGQAGAGDGDSRKIGAVRQPGEDVYAVRFDREGAAGIGELEIARHREASRAARQHYAGAQLPSIASGRHIALNEIEDLIHTLMDDVCKQLARYLTVALRHSTRQLQDL